MKKMKKLLSLLLVVVMVFGLMPMNSFATGKNNVYISISDDGKFVTDKNGEVMAYREISLDDLKSIDLDKYELSDYKYDADGNGSYELTAVHLYIYVHEVLMGESWTDVSVEGGAGSIYFSGGIFGFEDENLRYDYNGAYPADENGWGITADQIVLKEGDFFDIAHYTSWTFYMDSNYGFHYFVDDNLNVVHNYVVDSGETVSVKLVRTGGGMGMGESTAVEESDYVIYYGKSIGNATGHVTTNDSGIADITLTEAGTWYVWCDGGLGVDEACDAVVSSPASASITVNGKNQEEDNTKPDVGGSESVTTPDYKTVLNATMAQLAATVKEPAFGTDAGEWTVLSLARGGYYEKDNKYFTDYYNRIIETVNEKAASVDKNGALHKNKSTENSRLIVALASIGKDATSVGEWNLIKPYDDFAWIKNQGTNGVIWALIALDSNDYQTEDSTIRQQCIDYILEKQLEDGGWALSGTVSDPDITGMALQALYPYKNQDLVNNAAEEAFECLSEIQNEDGTYTTGTDVTAESNAQVIVACTTWGINPDTDARFIKNGNSAVDGLLAHYDEETAQFKHIVGQTTTNGMATDQSCYALVSYDRLLNNKTALYDMSDVSFDDADTPETPASDELTATLGLPSEINNGDTFNAIISINKWDNEAHYKLIDFIMTVPEGVVVNNVAASERLSGGEVVWNVDQDGKLRVVYFDANKNADLIVNGEAFPAELFKIEIEANEVANTASKLDFSIDGMSVKLTSDSEDENAMIIVNTDKAEASVDIVFGISFSAVELYAGDDVDLIPSTKKAVAVAVTGINGGRKLTYNDGTNTIEFMYNAEMSEAYGVATYVALVDASIAMDDNFVKDSNFALPAGEEAATITFGDRNDDGEINAQDALAAVDAWLRKSEALKEDGTLADNAILTLNVNGDSRVNTFDALGIVEAFVNNTVFHIVTKAATAFGGNN